MVSLDHLRRQIDRLDAALLDLLNQRGRLVKDVGTIKTKTHQPIFAPGRERDLLKGLKAKNNGPLANDAIEAVFREVVHACRNLQRDLKIAYFGPEATFTHQAALRQFGKSSYLRPCRSIADVFTEVEKDNFDYGVVPIENSTEGVVNHTLDMFVDSRLSICAELEMPIHHYLLGKKAAYKKKRSIRVVYSFPQALAQCRRWIEIHLPSATVREASSTADAAYQASRTPGSVAIASKLAAELYGLDVLESQIEDHANNFTRFLVIGKTEPAMSGRDKTTVLFSIKDKVGALHDILVPFKTFKLNMTKIESRPTRQRAWEYVFFVDFLGHRSELRVQKALAALEKHCSFLKILGSYPRTE